MEKKPCCLLLTHLKCISSTAESGHDDVFFEVYAGKDNGEETRLGRYFANNPIHMNGSNDDDANIDISFDESDVGSHNYIDYIKVKLWDNDSKNGWQEGDSRDRIGDAIIRRDDAIEGYKCIDQGAQGYGKGKAEYHLSYRVIDKPIQTLRIFGINCIEDSKGCNQAQVENILELAELAAEQASQTMSKNPRPRAQAISKGFEKSAEILGAISGLIVWALDTLEGDDEVYMQHVDKDNYEIQGGGWPTQSAYQPMKKDDEITFGEGSTEYIRVPLDAGAVTLQLREKDPITSDNCIGSITINESYYNNFTDKDAHIVVCDEYFRTQNPGQGALYQLCISVGMENWALPAKIDHQESALNSALAMESTTEASPQNSKTSTREPSIEHN